MSSPSLDTGRHSAMPSISMGTVCKLFSVFRSKASLRRSISFSNLSKRAAAIHEQHRQQTAISTSKFEAGTFIRASNQNGLPLEAPLTWTHKVENRRKNISNLLVCLTSTSVLILLTWLICTNVLASIFAISLHFLQHVENRLASKSPP